MLAHAPLASHAAPSHAAPRFFAHGGARPIPDNDIYKKAAPGEYWPSGLTGAGPQAEFSMGDWGWKTDPTAETPDPRTERKSPRFTVEGFRSFFNSAYGDDIDRHDIVYSTVFFLLYLVHWLVKPFFTSGSHFSTKYDSLLFTSLLLPLVMLALPALAPKLFGMATRKLGGGSLLQLEEGVPTSLRIPGSLPAPPVEATFDGRASFAPAPSGAAPFSADRLASLYSRYVPPGEIPGSETGPDAARLLWAGLDHDPRGTPPPMGEDGVDGDPRLWAALAG